MTDQGEVAKTEGEYQRAGTDLRSAKRGQAIVDYVLSGASLVTGGASEIAAAPIRRVIQKRIDELRETLVRDLKAGIITQDAVIEEDDLASFIIRIQRATCEGCAQQKLRLMIRYFLRSAPEPGYNEDMFLNFAGITEQLSHAELKVLAVIKAAIASGAIQQSAEGDQAGGRRIGQETDLIGLFPDQRAFNIAAMPLVRFGFLEMAAAWGGMALFVTDAAFAYLERADAELLVPTSRQTTDAPVS